MLHVEEPVALTLRLYEDAPVDDHERLAEEEVTDVAKSPAGTAQAESVLKNMPEENAEAVPEHIPCTWHSYFTAGDKPVSTMVLLEEDRVVQTVEVEGLKRN